MTGTHIPSILSNTPLTLSSLHDEGVDIQIGCDGGVYDRDEFLAAVATELDVIVINRADLPEVTVSPADGRIQARGATLHNGTATGGDALGWLAIDEHLEAHPPVDEAQVDALAYLLHLEPWTGTTADLARRLVAAGVRAPQAGDDQ